MLFNILLHTALPFYVGIFKNNLVITFAKKIKRMKDFKTKYVSYFRRE